LNCAQADELVGAFALDALPDDEAAAFRAHIAVCARHAEQAAELRSTAEQLADSVEPIEPPPALRARLLEAVAREPQERRSATISELAPAARAGEARRVPRGGWFTPNAWTAIAATLAIIAAVVGVWAYNAQDDAAGDLATAATDVRGLVDADGQRVGTVVYFGGEDRAAVFIDNLPDAGQGRAYQMWSIEGGEPVSLAVMDEGTHGRQVSVVNVDPVQSDALAITIEPAGGSEQPTSEPVFITET